MFSHFNDIVHAARSLAKARTFTIVCVTSLGLGMGVVIAIMLLVRTVFDTPPDDARNPISVSIGRQSASARFTERSQQGGYSIAGVGIPPFPR